MKKYIIEDTIKNQETGEVQIYYTGADGYVHSSVFWVDGYQREGNAKRKIEREIRWFSNTKGGKVIDERHCIESGKWHHTFKILVVDCYK